MVEQEIYPLDKAVKISFICPYCRKLQHSKVFDIPEPNFYTRSVPRSVVFKHYDFECKNPFCKQHFSVLISNSIMGGVVRITDIMDDDILKLSIN